MAYQVKSLSSWLEEKTDTIEPESETSSCFSNKIMEVNAIKSKLYDLREKNTRYVSLIDQAQDLLKYSGLQEYSINLLICDTLNGPLKNIAESDEGIQGISRRTIVGAALIITLNEIKYLWEGKCRKHRLIRNIEHYSGSKYSLRNALDELMLRMKEPYTKKTNRRHLTKDDLDIMKSFRKSQNLPRKIYRFFYQ
ncbi:MAG: hypothetical protein KGI02_03840 [Thaumarchaeota archaeon]|nr:hypothetical protein [Nitrososphaerota archaeon]MDE1877818.1 hypothetical protein [Nitrososphaerota archaeon]